VEDTECVYHIPSIEKMVEIISFPFVIAIGVLDMRPLKCIQFRMDYVQIPTNNDRFILPLYEVYNPLIPLFSPWNIFRHFSIGLRHIGIDEDKITKI